MNILYAINSGNPGGLEQHMLDLVRGMVKRGHRVFFWCADGEIVDWYKNAGADVTTHTIHGEIDISYIKLLTDFNKLHKIEVIHTGELKAGINVLLAGVLAKVPVRITHIHTPMSEWPAENLVKKIYRQLEIVFYSFLVNSFATYEIALTESRKQVKLSEGISENKLKVIPNALDTSRLDYSTSSRLQSRNELCGRYNIPENTIVLGNISRLTVEKGHEVLVRAYAAFLHKYPEQKAKTVLFLAGGGVLQDKLLALARELNIAENVCISGVFSSQEWAKYYALFDIYVFPSTAEGFGLVLIEGMYMGIPVICSDIPVLQEVAGDTVTYFKNGNVNDLSDKLANTVLCYDINSRWSKTSALKLVENKYTMDKFVQNYENLYQEHRK